MNQFSHNELEQIISLYIDGELDPVETQRLEEYLSTHPVTAKEVELLRLSKRALSSRPQLAKDDWFWLKLSNRIEGSRPPRTFLSARPAIAFTSLAVMTLAIVGVIFMKDAPMFHRYFLEKKSQVESVYRNNIMTGNILPLFANLNKDDVLNFALFGSIAIDTSNKTSLQVKNSDESGSQIQIVRNDERIAVPVTMNDFADEIGINPFQREIVDSILGSYKEKLQASVLVSENDEVAIHAELVDLNRAMVSTIAACLEPPQRTKFQRFLDTRNAPYAVVAVNTPRVPSHIILNKIPKFSSSNNYVVISPDTVEIAQMTINVDSIREVARRQEMRYRKLMTERMVAELTERQRRMEENFVGMGQNRVRIHSSSGTFQIHFDHAAPAVNPEFEMVDMVKPRMYLPEVPRPITNRVTVIGETGFSFEIPADERTVRELKRLPKGEFRFEIVDSMMREPKMKLMFRSPSGRRKLDAKVRELNAKEQNLIDLDSLLRESDNSPEQVPAKPKKSGKEIELEIML